MKNNYKLIFFLFAIAISLSGCYNTLLPFRIPTKQPDIPANSVEKEIPRYPKNKIFVYYKYAKQKQKQLDLSIPENGYDSLLIRFWFTYPQGFHQIAELLEIRINSKNEKIANYVKMRIFFNPSRDCEVINLHEDTLINAPRSGWLTFMEKMYFYRITQLPTIENIEEYKKFNRNRGGIDYENNSLSVAVKLQQKPIIDFSNIMVLKNIKC